MSHHMRAYTMGSSVLTIPADDNLQYDLMKDVCSNWSLDYITHCLEDVGSVLVTCYAGCNRSAAFILALVDMRFRMNVVDAFKLMSERRGLVLTNYHFRLMIVQAAIQGCPS